MLSLQNIEEEISLMLSIPDADLSEEQRTAMDSYLDELAGQEADKIDSFASFIRAESARAKYYREEAQRLSSKARVAEERIGFLKHRYLSTMQSAGLTKIQGNAYCVSIRHTPSVEVDDVDKLDDLYCRIIPARREPDKKILSEALKGGTVIPGCRLVTNDSLQIR